MRGNTSGLFQYPHYEREEQRPHEARRYFGNRLIVASNSRKTQPGGARAARQRRSEQVRLNRTLAEFALQATRRPAEERCYVSACTPRLEDIGKNAVANV